MVRAKTFTTHPADTEELARRIRLHSLRMTNGANTSHIGSCLSAADLLAVIYGEFANVHYAQPDWPDRDRIVMSKGHAAAALYAALAETGFIPLSALDRFGKDDQPLSGHVSHSNNPGVELSTGSLGHGLSVAAGFALAAKRRGSLARAITILSDGECDEGSIWEAALFAPHHTLSNLIAIVDYNKIQSFGRVDEVLALDPFADKWRSFNWDVAEIDGHNHNAIRTALVRSGATDKPLAILAHTVKGKGVSFMEDQLLWHYRPPSSEQLEQAIAEIMGTTT